MTQPEALRLAEDMERPMYPQYNPQAAAELRRLHAENEELWKEREEPHKTIEMYVSECNRLERERDALKAQRDALLEALRFIAEHDLRGTSLEVAGHMSHAFVGRARAAVEAVEEGK